LLRVMAVNKSPCKIPSTTKNIAMKIGQFGEIPIGNEIPAFTTVNIDLWGVRPAISKSMIEDEEFDVMQMQLSGAAKAMAEAENNAVITAIQAIASPQAQTYGTSQWATLTNAIAKVEVYGKPDVIAINPADKAKLCQDSTVASALSYSGKLLGGTGDITIMGLQLKVCNDVTAGNYWIIDSKNFGALLLRRDITIDDYEDPKNDLAGAVLTSRFGVGIINKLFACKTATA